ncbi:MAG: thiamine-phosphate kinase [Pyrinomonadaceae bacterium MAG19_C2-C3]|nr:thiamine-phosphate kinase [Pyrinomonadaceae bacterium MAG19_C2-C3]
MRGEFDFINSLKSKLKPDSSLTGIGDDAAVINQNSELQTVVSQDLLIEDIDFRRAWLPLNRLGRALGHKALAVSLSDIAAMGATPRYCLTSIGLPETVWRTAFIDEFYDSLLALARQHNTQLIGGDTSRSPDRIVIDCTVIGEIKRGRAVLRSTAKVGDLVFVSGELGDAATGLELLENGKRLSTGRTANPSLLTMDALIKRQLTPTPRVELGCHLAQHNLATSMIDISDGLAADLHHLCNASNTGALIDESRLPIAHAIHQLKTTRPPADLALYGGEDYELLFTVAPADKHKIPAHFDDESLTEIGIITEASEGITIKTGERSRPLKAKGFVHF